MIAAVDIRKVLLALLMMTALAGCTRNPATGKTMLSLMSMEEEQRLGEEAAPQFTAEFGGAVTDAQSQDYVSSIGHSLAAQTEAYFPELEWEFILLDSSVINAFALPGGKVFITRGLAEKMNNEAQLAGVLGHEIGHVTARHANQRITSQLGANLVLTGIAAVVGAQPQDSDVRQVGEIAVPALAIGGNLVLLKFGRDEELEADRLGMRYMERAGYNPAAQQQVMQILADASGSGGRPPELLSTHPYPERRMDLIQDLLSSRYQYVVDDPDYQFGEDRYQQFLNRLQQLPPPRHSMAILPTMSELYAMYGEPVGGGLEDGPCCVY